MLEVENNIQSIFLSRGGDGECHPDNRLANSIHFCISLGPTCPLNDEVDQFAKLEPLANGLELFRGSFFARRHIWRKLLYTCSSLIWHFYSSNSMLKCIFVISLSESWFFVNVGTSNSSCISLTLPLGVFVGTLPWHFSMYILSSPKATFSLYFYCCLTCQPLFVLFICLVIL